DDLVGGVGQALCRDDFEVTFVEHLAALFRICAFQANHHRNLQADFPDCLDNTFGNQITAHDTAKDVDQNGLDVGAGSNQLERLGHPFGRGATADIEEIRRRAAMQLDQIHGAHGQAGAVDHATDIAVELNVG